MSSYLALLQMGFAKLPASPPGLVRFYRTVSPVQRVERCSLLSVALSIASPLLGVTQHPALRSPDFPHPDCSKRDHLPNSNSRYDNTSDRWMEGGKAVTGGSQKEIPVPDNSSLVGICGYGGLILQNLKG